MSTATPAPRWRAVTVTTLVPTFLFSLGQGALLPVLPLVADDLGADLATAGLVSAMLMVGVLVGDIPSGIVIARIGERVAMVAAAGVAILGAVVGFLAPNPAVLAAAVFVIGLGGAVFALARHAFLTTFVPVSYRARALSTLGGTHRLGLFVGPFLSAALLQLTDLPASAFGVLAVGCLLAALVLVLLRDPESVFGAEHRSAAPTTGELFVADEAHGLFRTLWARRSVLATVGLGSAIMSALRASRLLILPLWAVSIGLDGATAALIIGIAGGIDFALFYGGGWLMDRFGRLWVAVPSLASLSLAHLALAFTHDAEAPVAWFVVLAFTLAVANGLSSGILMTLGSDLADPRQPALFLGAWRFTNDLGGASAPLVIAGVTAAASLPVAAAVIAGVGLVGATVWRFSIPRHVSRTPRGRGR